MRKGTFLPLEKQCEREKPKGKRVDRGGWRKGEDGATKGGEKALEVLEQGGVTKRGLRGCWTKEKALRT